MKIYVDEKPILCKNCLFYKSKQLVSNFVQPLSGGGGYGGGYSVGTVSMSYTKECSLLNIAVTEEIANITTLGNCPLEEIKVLK